MKRMILVFLVSIFASSAKAQNDFWSVYVVDDFSSIFPFYETVRGTEMVSFSAISGACASGKTIQECNQYFQYNLSALASSKLDIPSGSTSQYMRGDGSLASFPSIPSAQVQSDWNAVSGMGAILNKPSIPAAQVNSDWNSASGLSQVLNKPSLAAVALSGAYSDLTGKPTLATVATTGVYSDLTGKPSLASVATSGSYNDLSNKPSIPAAQIQSDWNQASSGAVDFIKNKPTVQAIQRTRAQTNTSGAYTWTYPSAYAGGVVPIIQAQVEDGTSGAIWNVQLTSVSNTAATVQITKTTAVTVLGISVLGVSANPQAYVHFTAVAP